MTPDKPWFLSRGGKTFGPYPFGQLQQWATSRQIAPEDVIWQDGMPSWIPAGSVEGLFAPAASTGAGALFHLKRAGEWNRIEVRSTRKGVVVRTRSGYMPPS